jgi:benzoyl-CoA reductase/2-hydroxyglutaryl-CoA dehydratase subunit BcrC/BadD/HgdB
MDIYPFLGEVHPSAMAFGTPEVCWDYVDTAEENGTPPEVCVLDKFMLGALLRNQMPQADFIVTASAPCDSSRIGYQMFEQVTDCPVYRLDAPAEDSPEAHSYYAGEIRKLIAFLEAQTGNRFDADRLREVCEESNRGTDALLELFELRRARPCPHPGSVTFNSYLSVLNCLGLPALTRYIEFLRDDAADAVRQGRGALAEEKYRVLWYYVPVTFDIEMHAWLEENFKAVVIMDLLSSFFRQDPIDTTNLDTMLLGLARRGLEATMGRLRVNSAKLSERFLRDYADFAADCVVFPGPVGCKHVWGWLGLLREICRERGIPICAFDLDWMDSRVRSVDSVRATIEEFFTTVME